VAFFQCNDMVTFSRKRPQFISFTLTSIKETCSKEKLRKQVEKIKEEEKIRKITKYCINMIHKGIFFVAKVTKLKKTTNLYTEILKILNTYRPIKICFL
jgi:hypothetical protein